MQVVLIVREPTRGASVTNRLRMRRARLIPDAASLARTRSALTNGRIGVAKALATAASHLDVALRRPRADY